MTDSRTNESEVTVVATSGPPGASTTPDGGESGRTTGGRARSGIRRIPRRALAIGGSAVVVAAIIGAALGVGGGSGGSPVSGGGQPATVAVKRSTLTQTQNVGGLLSYGEPVALVAPATLGVVTWVAAPGTVVKQGERAYKIDNKPVVLIHGTVTPFRTLHEGDTGADVKQLESALSHLGLGQITVDGSFDATTAQAVRAWQAKLGNPPTGTVAPAQLVVAPSDIRIASQQLPVGCHLSEHSNQTVLTYSGTPRVATIPVETAQQQFVKKGQTATVILPDGTHVAGTVSTVGKVAQKIKDKQIINVIISIKDQHALGTLDAAPVSLQVGTGTRTNVLVVPVGAMLALPGGGYGLQVIKDGKTSFAAVKTGMFADGMVEVSGVGIGEGTIVGMAK